jgi:anti-sigma B factor antagonist
MTMATRVHVTPNGLTTLAVSGEVDLASSESLHGSILQAMEATPGGSFIVDLDGVSFLDSTGIGALVRGYRAARDREIPYQVINAGGTVRQVLEITGVLELLGNPTGAVATSRTEDQAATRTEDQA